MNTVQTVENETPQIVMISIECNMFGGYKRSSERDIIEAGGVVPDTDILTKGGKHIYPTDRLATFRKVKKDIFKDLWEYGVKGFGSGSVIAINAAELDRAESLLETAKRDFYALLAELDANYDKWLAEFLAEQKTPAAVEIIQRAALTKDDAVSRFKFDFTIFTPTPIGKHGSVESMYEQCIKQLYQEVAQAAYGAWDKTFFPEVVDSKGKKTGQRERRKVGQKSKSAIRNCRKKLFNNAYLHPNIIGAVTAIDSVLSQTLTTGWIEDTPSNPSESRLFGLVTLMSDADKLAAAASQIMQSVNVDLDIDILCGVAKPVSTKVPEPENLFNDFNTVPAAAAAAVASNVASETVDDDLSVGVKPAEESKSDVPEVVQLASVVVDPEEVVVAGGNQEVDIESLFF